MLKTVHFLAAFIALAIAVAPGARAQDAKTPDYEAIVAAPDRTDADREADQRRNPAKMLAFTEVKICLLYTSDAADE